MKRLFLALAGWLLCLTLHAQSPQYLFQYWFDGDYAAHVDDSSTGGVWQKQMETGHLPTGFHTMYLHFRDTSGRWSSPRSYLFYHAGDTAAGFGLEYACWFDQDYARHSSGTVGGDMLVDVTNLSEGFHTLNVMTGSGRSAALQSFLFYKVLPHSSDNLNISYACWFDQDYSHRTSGTLGGDLLLDVTALGDGFHTLNVQTGDGHNAALQSFLFYKVPPHSSDNLNVSYACWFDQNVDSIQSGMLTQGHLLLDVTALREGFHTVNLQVGSGDAIMLTSALFYKIPVQDNSHSLNYVCWFDEDYDTRTSGELGDGHLLFDVSSLRDGFHTVNLQTGDGRTAALQSWLFYKLPDYGSFDDSAQLTWHYSIDGREQPALTVTPTNRLIHLDLDVDSITPGLHSMSYYLVASNGKVSELNTAFFYRTGTGIVRYEYRINGQDSTRTVVDMQPVDTLRLITMLQLPTQPIRSTCFEFDANGGTPVIYAKNDITFRFWTGDNRFIDRTSYYVDEQVKDTVIADTLERNSSRTIASPTDNSIHWFRLAAAPGDSLFFNTNRGCMFQLYAPSGEMVLQAEGGDAIAGRGCHSWETGDYYLAVHEAGTEYDSLTVNYQWIYKYAVLDHSPDIAGNGPSIITLHLSGNGLEKISNAILFNADTTWIMDSILASCNSDAFIDFLVLDSIPLGQYNLLLEFTDESYINDTLFVNSILNIVPAEFGDIEITYDYVSSFTEPHIINVHITNTGNISYLGVPIVFAHTKSDVSSLRFLDYYMVLDSLDQVDSMYHNATDLFGRGVHAKYIPFILNRIEPYQSYHMRVEFNCPRGQSFDFYAWAGRPWSRVDNTDQAVQGNTKNINTKASNTGRDMCDMPDPCDIVGAAECLCGLSMGIIKSLAGALAAPVLKSRRQAEAWAREQGFEDDIYGEQPQLQTPSSILREAMEHCTPERAQAATAALFAAWDELDGEDCPNPTPIHPTVPSPPVDPNEITGYIAESGSLAINRETVALPYVIEFENDPNLATSNAVRVTVIDTLDGSKFDLSSFAATGVTVGDRQLSVDNKQQFVSTIDMRPDINTVAQVELNYDAVNGIVHWTLKSLDPMTLQEVTNPKQGLLPVNAGTNGIGTLSFTINRKDNLPDGDTIPNRASIVFDNEEAIMTPTWTNTLDLVDPVSQISHAVTIEDSTTLYFHGTDNRSGIWRYTLYGRTDSTAEWSVLANSIADSLYQVSVDNGMVDYRVTATDSAGNQETKTSADIFVTTQGVPTYHTVTVVADAEQGSVTGGGLVRKYRNTTLMAIPNYGYRFIAWNDGNTDNPRVVTVTRDTVFTALFDEAQGSYRTEQATACDVYVWNINGERYHQSGVYQCVYTNDEGAVDTVDLYLTVYPSQRSREQVTHCGAYTWEVDGRTYNKSGTKYYKSTTPEGCPLRDTLDLTIVDRWTSHEQVSTCDGSYTWAVNGRTYNKSGVKTYKGVAADGCPQYDTLTLVVGRQRSTREQVTHCGAYTWEVDGRTYNKSGTKYYKGMSPEGCPLRDTLDLTIVDRWTSHEQVTTCDGSYTWAANGKTYNKSGVKTYKGVAADGCPQYDTLTLVVGRQRSSREQVTHCGSYTWSVDGRTYNKSGTKYYKSTTPEGCPLRDTLDLTIVDRWTSHEQVSTCDGSYTWEVNGKTYNKSGVKTYKGVAADGCPQYDTLTLVVGRQRSSHEQVTHCGSYTWSVDGRTYNKSGTKYYKSTTPEGCPLRDTLDLTIVDRWTSHEQVTTCDGSYTWAVNGKTYNKSGVKTYKGVAADGCPKYDTLTLVVGQQRSSREQVTHCGSYTWEVDGRTYNKSGVKYYKSTTPEGCPLRDTLDLTIVDRWTSHEQVTTCDGFYTWAVNGKTYNKSGVKTFKSRQPDADGCYTYDTLRLNIVKGYSHHEYVENCGPYYWDVTGKTYNKSGVKTYKSAPDADGCPTYDTLELVILNCDKSPDDNSQLSTLNSQLSIYPNPTTGLVHIDVKAGSENNFNSQLSTFNLTVEVLDLVGRRVALFDNTITFDLSNLADGTYTLRITTPDGVAIRKVVKK